MNDPEYKNWLKCQQALYIMQQVLKPLILHALKYFVQEVKQKNRSSYDESKICRIEECANGRIKLKEGENYLPFNLVRSFCRNCNCGIFVKTIMNTHNKPQKAFFENCNIGNWPLDDWEVAKAFCTIYFDCKTGASDTVDIGGWLTILKNCTEFHCISDYKETDTVN